jgi:hypothetical protein
MPDRWEQYGIDPAEITASVDAAVVGNTVARECAEDASAALLRALRERATPFMRSSTKAQQAAFAAAVAGKGQARALLSPIAKTMRAKRGSLEDGGAELGE